VTPAPQPDAIAAELLEAAARALPEIAAPSVPPAGPGSADRHLRAVGLSIVGIGWATVDLDRAAAELGTLLDVPADAWTAASRDQLLGAAALLGPPLGPDAGGPRLLLLEPDTEGRLAASLARHGERVAAVYVVEALDESGASAKSVAGDAQEAPARSVAAPGPLGQGRLILGGASSGPHVVVLEAATNSESLPSAGD